MERFHYTPENVKCVISPGRQNYYYHNGVRIPESSLSASDKYIIGSCMTSKQRKQYSNRLIRECSSMLLAGQGNVRQLIDADRNELQASRGTIQRLRDNIAELENKFRLVNSMGDKGQQQEINRLRTEIIALRDVARLADIKIKECMASEQKTAMMKTELLAGREKIRLLMMEIDRLKAMGNLNEDGQNELDRLRQDIQTILMNIHTLRGELKDCDGEKQQLIDKIEMLTEEIGRLKSKGNLNDGEEEYLVGLRNQIQTLQGDLKTSQVNGQKVYDKLVRMRTDEEECTKRVNTLIALNKKANKDLKMCQDNGIEYSSQIYKGDKIRDELLEQIKKTEDELKLCRDNGQEIAALKQELARLKAEEQNHYKIRHDLRKQGKKAEEQLKVCQDNNQEIAALKQELDRRKAEEQEHYRIRHTLRKEGKKAQEELAQAQNNLNACMSDSAIKSDKINRLNALLEGCEKNSEGLKTSYTDCRNETFNLLNRNKDLLERIKIYDGDNSKQIIADLTDNVQNLKDQIRRLDKDYAATMIQLRECSSNVNRGLSDDDVQKYTTRISSLERDMSTMRTLHADQVRALNAKILLFENLNRRLQGGKMIDEEEVV